jgi:phage host-nuclease inhibitor protein Gam
MDKELEYNIKRLSQVTNEIASLQVEEKELKVYFEKRAEAELANSKFKTAQFATGGIKVSVTNAETPKVIADTIVLKLLGKVADKYVSVEQKHNYKALFKKMLVAAVKNAFVKQTVESIVEGLTADADTQSLLKKKLKGKFEQDKVTLIGVLEISDDEASETAYLIEEAVNYKVFLAVLKDVGFEGDVDELIEELKAVVIVEDKLKVSIE